VRTSVSCCDCEYDLANNTRVPKDSEPTARALQRQAIAKPLRAPSGGTESVAWPDRDAPDGITYRVELTIECGAAWPTRCQDCDEVWHAAANGVNRRSQPVVPGDDASLEQELSFRTKLFAVALAALDGVGVEERNVTSFDDDAGTAHAWRPITEQERVSVVARLPRTAD